MEHKIEFAYGVMKMKEPIYWFEDGRIRCDTGSSIGCSDSKMTESEAIEMASIGGIKLSPKPTKSD